MNEPKKALETPRVDGFKVFAKMSGTFKEVEAGLRSVSFLETVAERDGVTVAYIESRDIDKNPYVFAVIKFKSDSIEVLYSIPPTIAPRKRKLDMVRYFLNLLTYVNAYYSVEPAAIYQLVDAALKEMNEFVSMDYNKLYTTYDSMKKDQEDALRRFKRAQQELEVLKEANYELKTRNDELTLRVKQLEAMSDDTLKDKVQEWISEHSGEINISEFSKFYKLPESRVEEILNILVKEGYVQTLQ